MPALQADALARTRRTDTKRRGKGPGRKKRGGGEGTPRGRRARDSGTRGGLAGRHEWEHVGGRGGTREAARGASRGASVSFLVGGRKGGGMEKRRGPAGRGGGPGEGSVERTTDQGTTTTNKPCRRPTDRRQSSGQRQNSGKEEEEGGVQVVCGRQISLAHSPRPTTAARPPPGGRRGAKNVCSGAVLPWRRGRALPLEIRARPAPRLLPLRKQACGVGAGACSSARGVAS